MNIYPKNTIRHTHLLALMLIVLLPVGLIVWATLWYERYSRAQQVQALSNLIGSRLEDVSLITHRYFEDLKSELEQDRQLLSPNPSAIRKMLSKATHIRQVFIIDANGNTQWPNPSVPLSQEENKLIARLGTLWNSKRLHEHAMIGQERVVPNTTSNQYVPIGKSYRGFQQQQAFSQQDNFAHAIVRDGWYVWYANDEMIHIYWWLDTSGRIWGFELSPQRILADLISSWPHGSTSQINANFHIRDNQGQVIYQWGPHTPSEGETYRKMLPLPAPLSSWQVEYYAPETVFHTGGVYAIGLGILLGLFMALLGLFLYREQRRAALEAQQQVSFVNQVSHELKTPLTNIRMYAEMLGGRVDDDARSGRYLSVINTESERLSRLIGNILNFSKSKRGLLNLTFKATNLKTLLTHCRDQFAPIFEQNGFNLSLTYEGEETLHIDSDAIEQIMVNLITNAEKYGQSDVAITARINPTEQQAEIDVRDFGPGVPKEQQKYIFDEFFRVDTGLDQPVSGSGIGLTIARALAHRHCGLLRYEDANPGARFILTLPLPIRSSTNT